MGLVTTTAEDYEERNNDRNRYERRDDRKWQPGTVAQQSVADDAKLQSREAPSHDISIVSCAPPTSATNASSSERPLRIVSRGPDATIAPRCMIATSEQSRSTSSITWLDRTTVPPLAVYCSKTDRIVRADTGSTPSKGSSRKSTRGECSSAAARVTFLRIP